MFDCFCNFSVKIWFSSFDLASLISKYLNVYFSSSVSAKAVTKDYLSYSYLAWGGEVRTGSFLEGIGAGVAVIHCIYKYWEIEIKLKITG